jgi:hypothetical protein
VEGSILSGMAFLLPVLIFGGMLLAAPQIAIGAVILAAAVGVSAAFSKLVFAVIGHPVVTLTVQRDPA